MKLIYLAALGLLTLTPSDAWAGSCNWKFTVNNQTSKTVVVRRVATRVTVLWKSQWSSPGVAVPPGQKTKLPGYGLVPDGYSFSSDTDCKPSKEIDFEVLFDCSYAIERDSYLRVARNRVRDGEHTVKITKCGHVTTG